MDQPDYREKMRVAVKALREIRDMQGIVCTGFALCHHKACASSYASWQISDKALAIIEELDKQGCRIYKSVKAAGIPEAYQEQLEEWIDEGKGIAIYAMREDGLNYGARPRKYCSFGTPSATIPNCEIPPNTMPMVYKHKNPENIHYLIGYIPMRKTVDLKGVCGA